MTVADGALRVDSERTRRRILDEARELCRVAGSEQIRMDEVARRVGCARATVYNHFGSRDQLIDAMCGEYLDGFLIVRDGIRDGVRPEDTVFEVLRETVAAELRWRVTNGDLRIPLDRARRNAEGFYVTRNQRIDDAMVEWFGAIHRAAERAGLLRPGLDVPSATASVYAMVDHVVAEFPVDTAPQDVDRAADQVARLQWHALFRDEPSRAPMFATLDLEHV